MEQHAVYTVKGIVADRDGFPMENSAQAYTLGGGGGGGRGERDSGKAAERRRRMGLGLVGGTFVLGGGGGGGRGGRRGTNNGMTRKSSSLQHLPPGEAARIAAERRLEERRKHDANFCLPCAEIIEILDGSSSDEDEDEDEEDTVTSRTRIQRRNNHSNEQDCKTSSNAPLIPKRDTTSTDRHCETIDLTGNINNNDESKSNPATKSHQTNSIPTSPWSCTVCTYHNEEPTVSICSACHSTRTKVVRRTPLSFDDDCNAVGKGREEDDQIGGNGTGADGSASEEPEWSCTRCTYENVRPLSLVCDLCGEERTVDFSDAAAAATTAATAATTRNTTNTVASSRYAPSLILSTSGVGVTSRTNTSNGGAVVDPNNEEAIRQVIHSDFIQSVREEEVTRSEMDFGGFNIYGSSKRKSATMHHLT